jgi:hypothetical protein
MRMSREEAHMPIRTPTRAVAAVLTAVFASACGNAPGAPTPLPTTPAATALLMVQVDKVCEGRESDIRVFVDHVPIGVTNPGQAGVSLTVAIGEHQLSAVSQEGTLWGPFPTTVLPDGRLERLGCMPPDAI